MPRRLAVCRVLVAALCAMLLAALTACTVCTEQIVDETISPDHAWTTRTTVRNCGNLATPTTNVYIERADSRAKLGEIIVLIRHAHPVKIVWSSSTQLRIECTACGNDVRIARPSAHGISIVVAR
jgi:hypothetical protein